MAIDYIEHGSLGLEAYSGFVTRAYHADLYWPGVYPLYNRLRRSDPEITVVRQIFETVAAGVRIEVAMPDDPQPDEERFAEFYSSALADVEGGIAHWRDTLIAYVPFMGWGWWEAVPGVRRRDWTPPGDDVWRSQSDDGLTGIRRLAFRDHSSFESWDLADATGKLRGMWQMDFPNPRVRLPLENSVHITFGDANNPEGLTPLEAVWRLERIKYGLEVVQGIGYEHAAGHLNVLKTEKGELSATDKANIKAAARAILSAQEGNYAAWPYGFTGSVVDVPFCAAASILEAVKFYSVLKLAVYNLQWVGMSTTSGTGSYAALSDSSALWLTAYNAMMTGFVAQLDAQLGARLLALNRAAFPGLERRPKLRATRVEKIIDLAELGAFMTQMRDLLPLGEADYVEVRRRSGFLPEALPEVEQTTPVAPAAGELTARYRALAAQSAGRAHLHLTPRARYAELAGERGSYRQTVYEAVLKYLVQTGAGSRSFANAIKRAIVEEFPAAFYAAYAVGGNAEVDPADDRWLTGRITEEVSYVDSLFEALKEIKDEKLPPRELVAEAEARADGYAATLDGLWAQGMLRGAKNVMLTMVGMDGQKSCRDCQRLKGKRYSAGKWTRLGIPGVPGNNYECRGYNCLHYLIDDRGNTWP